MPVMVFHAPFELQENPTAASALRPVRMLKAFENIGYKVWKVTGTGKERKKSLRALGRAIRGGLKVEFVYSESATIPNAFTEPRHFPLRPFLDAEFFALMHRHNIPIGVFYRDIYWVFDEYKERVGAAVAAAMSTLYRWDLAVYRHFVTVLFVPSIEMSRYIPGKQPLSVGALPPGADYQPTSLESRASDEGLNLVYVGGVSPGHYDISFLLQAVSRVPGVSLTLCTPESGWEQDRDYYSQFMSEAVRVVHRDSNNLDDLYEGADVAALFVRPQEYRTFAAPVKLFEYLGRGKPIIASAGTHAANIVKATQTGWVIDYDIDELAQLLELLCINKQQLAKPTQRSNEIGPEHTWEARARLAAETLVDIGSDR